MRLTYKQLRTAASIAERIEEIGAVHFEETNLNEHTTIEAEFWPPDDADGRTFLIGADGDAVEMTKGSFRGLTEALGIGDAEDVDRHFKMQVNLQEQVHGEQVDDLAQTVMDTIIGIAGVASVSSDRG